MERTRNEERGYEVEMVGKGERQERRGMGEGKIRRGKVEERVGEGAAEMEEAGKEGMKRKK